MSKTLAQITTALESDKSAIRQAILSGGGTCPEGHGFDEFASDIGSIPVNDIDAITESMYECGTSDVRTGLSTEDMIAANYNSLYYYQYVYSMYTKGTKTYSIGGNVKKAYSISCSYQDGQYISTDTTYFPLYWYPGTSSSPGSNIRYAMCDLFKKRKGYLTNFYIYVSTNSNTTVSTKYKFCLLHQSNTQITTTPSGNIIDISQVLSVTKTIGVSGWNDVYFSMLDPNQATAIDWDSVDEKVYKDYVLALCLLEVTCNNYPSGVSFSDYNGSTLTGSSCLRLKQKYTPE